MWEEVGSEKMDESLMSPFPNQSWSSLGEPREGPGNVPCCRECLGLRGAPFGKRDCETTSTYLQVGPLQEAAKLRGN